MVAGTHKTKPGAEQAKESLGSRLSPGQGPSSGLGHGHGHGPVPARTLLKQEDIANAATQFSLDVTKVRYRVTTWKVKLSVFELNSRLLPMLCFRKRGIVVRGYESRHDE